MTIDPATGLGSRSPRSSVLQDGQYIALPLPPPPHSSSPFYSSPTSIRTTDVGSYLSTTQHEDQLPPRSLGRQHSSQCTMDRPIQGLQTHSPVHERNSRRNKYVSHAPPFGEYLANSREKTSAHATNTPPSKTFAPSPATSTPTPHPTPLSTTTPPPTTPPSQTTPASSNTSWAEAKSPGPPQCPLTNSRAVATRGCRSSSLATRRTPSSGSTT
jgi:hypothetical protein